MKNQFEWYLIKFHGYESKRIGKINQNKSLQYKYGIQLKIMFMFIEQNQ